MVRNVVQATLDGWRQALADPENAVTYTLKQSVQLSREHERKMLEASRNLIVPDNKGIGWMEMGVWEEMYQLLHSGGFIEANMDVAKAFRVDFLQSTNK